MYESGGRSSERGTSRSGAMVIAAACLGVGGVGFALYLFAAPYQTLKSGLSSCRQMLDGERGKVAELRKSRETLASDLTAFKTEAAARQGRSTMMAKLSDGLRADLAGVLDKTGFDVTARGSNLVIRVPEAGVFQGKGAEISADGTRALRKLAAWLRGKPVTRVAVSAFLDGSPPPRELRKKVSDDWELAMQRAGNAARILMQAGVSPAALIASGGSSAKSGDGAAVGRRRFEIELRVE